MSNKMLIDASHPEETRVAVVRGNRVEEFDFESQEKKQLRGNIYLAKVTRVEPSLQAAFVDYGGNRHGFLAFSEIHPDYYQIPVADRQALIEAEAEEARASKEAEDAELTETNDNTTLDDEEAPKRKPRRRRSRKSKTEEISTDDADETVSAEDALEEPEKSAASSDDGDEVAEDEKPKRRSTRRKKAPIAKNKIEQEDGEDTETSTEASPEQAVEGEVNEVEEEAKPKRRTTRRRKAPVKEAMSDEQDADDTNDEDDGNPTSMAAMVETDSISEPLPTDSDGDDDEPSDDNDSADNEPVTEEKPKRRPARRKKAPVKAKADEESAEDIKEEQEQALSETADEAEEQEQSEKPAKQKRAPRRNSRRKKTEASDEEKTETDIDENDADADTDVADPAEGVESVGQEDALEEVPTPRRQRRHYKIQEVIKRRQVLLVQVVKEERGNKGAALTTYLSLAGRYSVLMPNTARGGGISRKITNAADRKRLKAIANGLEVPDGMGVILRTAGASRTNAEIERDFDYLMRLWEQVRNLTLSSTAPCLVYEEGSLIKRSIRDLYDKDTGEVLVAGEDGYNEARDFMTMLMPSAAKKVKLFRNKQSIFAKYGVETQLDKMVTPQVTLKSGGYLIIDQTEALVAVDVNSGRSTREHSIESTALQTNLEAAEEVARQLRLRDLAGLIVIDFIDMEEKRNNRAVEKKLKDCLKNDRARIQVGRISHFGLMEMSRQRMRASVLESTMDVCPMCGGTGHVRSDSAIALHVFRAIEEHVSRHNRYDAIVKTTPAIALHILNHKRSSLLDLENLHGLAIIIEGSTDVKGQDFVIEKGEPASGEVKSSAVGYQDGNVDTDDTAEEEEPQSRGRKRSRGRRKKRDEDMDTEQSSEETGSENTASDPDEDDQHSRKRRRGKRGGRRRNTDETSNEETSAEAIDDGQNAEPSKEKVAAEASQEEATRESVQSQTENVEEEKPKQRSTTRRKAPISKPAETQTGEEQSDDKETKSSAQAEPPRKPRRTTRRKQTDEQEMENVSLEASAQQQPVSSSEPENEDGNTENTDDGTGEQKKKGWWNRGGGFF